MAIFYSTTQVESDLPAGQGPSLAAQLNAIDATPLLFCLSLYHLTGRPGYPLEAMWRAYAASFSLNLPHTNALIRLLEDDPYVRGLCGFGHTLPHRTTFNRFIQRLSDHSDLVEQAFASATDRLRVHLPNLGEVVAVDATTIRSHSNGNRKPHSDPEAKWGYKNSARVKATPKSRNDGKEWVFGYRGHAVADANHGVPLAIIVTPANQNDSPMLPPVMERAASLYDWWDPKVAIADKGYDALTNHEWLDNRGTLPTIHIRRPTKADLHHGIYTPEGVPTCMGGEPMEYAGTDPETGKRLRICREGGCHLKNSRKGAVSYCDSEVWEDPAENLRLFGRVRRDSHAWKTMYAKRQAIERVFKGMKESRRLERHCVRGLRRITLHALMSALRFQATVLAHLEAGDTDLMRWQVRKID